MADLFDVPPWMESGFQVGAWNVQPRRNRLIRTTEGDDTPVRLEPKVMQVLLCLAEDPGKTVTKQQFMERVWGDTVVTDDVLARCISELRKALGDDARDPRYIETIRKTGYRLVAPVNRHLPEEKPPDEEAEVVSVEVAPSSSSPSWPSEASDFLEWRWEAMNAWLRQIAQRPRVWGPAVLLAALTAGLLWMAAPFSAEQPSTPPQAVPFTSFPGEEFDPALSPNGNRVAFVWDGGDRNQLDVYVKQMEAETPLRITDHPAKEHSPSWSPDGQRIAFVRSSEDGHAVYVVPALGGQARRVTSFGTRKVSGLVWSPDGNTLALSAQRSPYEAFSLFLLSVKTGQKRQLTAPPVYYRGDLTPAFSPDGEQLAFARSVTSAIQDVFAVPVTGGSLRRLTADHADIRGLDWTADGRSIVFGSNRSGSSRLWRIPAEGGTPTWIAAAGGKDGAQQPSIARKGASMTFTQRSFNTNIWRLRWVRGYGNVTERLILSTRGDTHPDISPAGDRVAFASQRSGSTEIWTSSPQGTDLMKLTSFEGAAVTTPRWSPDGTHLAFSVRKERQADIYVMPAEGGTPHRLTTTASSEVAPSWSHDGRHVYFASNRDGAWQIWKRPLRDGPAQRVTQDGGFAARESPDGEHLFYTKRTVPGIWRRPLDSDSATQVVEALDPSDWGNWAVLKRGIYFIRRDREGPTLAYHRFSSRATTPVKRLKRVPRHPSLAVAPNGRWFLFTQIDRSESDILLVEDFR